MTLVSVIIPTYNRAKLISRSIKSVLNQSVNDFELILVDDGSIDKTPEVVYKLKDERIKYFRCENNNGQNTARNIGLSLAKGKFIAFLDSDDEWMPDYLHKMINVFNQDSTLGAVYSRAYGCSDNGELYQGYQFHLAGDIYKEALEQGYLSYMITIMLKKEIIDSLLPYPFDPQLSYGDDDDFCFKVAKICKIGLIKENLAIIHNDGAITGSEPSICKNVTYIVQGRHKLIDKYRDDILKLCGKKVMAAKYLMLSKLYLQVRNIQKARDSASLSYETYKSINSLIYLIYCNSSIIRLTLIKTMSVYRYMKNIIKRKLFFVLRK